MMKQQQGIVYGGVDTHLDVHVAAVIDSTGRLLATKSFPTSPLGLRQLERWLAGHGQVAKVGVEGTGTYGYRIKAHVTLCFLALFLVRVAENHTGLTWSVIARELDRIHAVDFAGSAGTVRQRTEIIPDACTVPTPPLILATAPAHPPRSRARKTP